MKLDFREDALWADIFWDDLRPETQKKLLEQMGDNGNYDVFPIASVNVTKGE